MLICSCRSPAQVSERLDRLIAEIKTVIEKSSPSWPSGQIVSRGAVQAQDIVCVGHGHVLAAFVLRWVGLPLEPNAVRLVLEPSGVAVLGYVYHLCVIGVYVVVGSVC